jgi:predicted esterase
MAIRLQSAVLALAVAFVGACGDDGVDFVPPDAAVPPDAYIGPSQARFEVPRDGDAPPSGFYALPFPNDIRVGEDGRMDLSDYIRPNALLDNYIEIFAEKQRGFSINAAIFFRFTQPIDPASLPQEPADAQESDATVYLVNVDPDSARRGETSPLWFRFEHFAGETIGDDWLSVLPYPGFPLEEQATYAAVVTTRLRAPDGTAVAAAPDFATILATSAPSDPELARAQQLYQPLLDWLDEPGGDERADVISAAVFTTADVTGAMGKIREAVFELDVPEPRKIEWLGDFDDFAWYDGVYDAPNFQTGSAPYMTEGGEIIFDDVTGMPIVQHMEEMRLSFSIPKGERPSGGWPVVLYAHGTGGSYHTFKNNGTAARMAQRGLAVVGIDQVLHGPRNPGASPEISFFNFQNPLSARDNTRQGALDNVQLLRLVKAFDYTERHPGGRTIRFDPDRMYFFGHSQGGLTGPPWLAYEPEIPGAVLSGAGGLLYLSLLNKTEPINIPDILGAFIRDFPLDEFNPVFALLQMWLDAADPASYGPLLFRNPPDGIEAKHIFQSEGFTDRFTPNVAIEALATSMGVDQVAPSLERLPGLELRGTDVLNPPVTTNRNGVTAVLLQYDEEQGSDGHFVLFDIEAAKKQSSDFIGSLAATGTATVPAP